MDLAQHMNILTINEEKSLDITKLESLKQWIEGYEKLQPDYEIKSITDVYKNNIQSFSVVLIKIKSHDQIHFYKIQVRKHKTENKYWLFRTWGTISTVFGDDLLQILPKKFCIKKYKWLIRDRIKRKFITLDMKNTNLSLNIKGNFESKLPISVQNLIKLIFNSDNICKIIEDYKLDTKKIRTGKLSNKKIRQAYGTLKMILNAINIVDDLKKDAIIKEASIKFYSYIPHLLNKSLPLLNNHKIIKEKLDMLNELDVINFADKIINFRVGKICNIWDIYYDQLKTEICELDINTKEYKIIEKYINNTHSFVHNKYKINIEKIFTINREDEDKIYSNRTRGIKNKMLLWHGTKLTNIPSILSKGLRIPRNNSSDLMFGRGIYFTDVVSKFVNYFRAKNQNSTAVLLLCEVALGNMQEQYKSNNNLVLKKHKHSVFAKGSYGPNYDDCIEITEGVIVPYGKLIQQKLNNNTKLKLIHNEFVVYCSAQIKIKYLIQINFN